MLCCEVKEQMGIFFFKSLEVPGEGEAEGTIYQEGWTKNEGLGQVNGRLQNLEGFIQQEVVILCRAPKSNREH